MAAVVAVEESKEAADTQAEDTNDAANDLAPYESQPFVEFDKDLFYTSGTWSEDEEGNAVLKSGVV